MKNYVLTISFCVALSCNSSEITSTPEFLENRQSNCREVVLDFDKITESHENLYSDYQVMDLGKYASNGQWKGQLLRIFPVAPSLDKAVLSNEEGLTLVDINHDSKSLAFQALPSNPSTKLFDYCFKDDILFWAENTSLVSFDGTNTNSVELPHPVASYAYDNSNGNHVVYYPRFESDHVVEVVVTYNSEYEKINEQEVRKLVLDKKYVYASSNHLTSSLRSVYFKSLVDATIFNINAAGEVVSHFDLSTYTNDPTISNFLVGSKEITFQEIYAGRYYQHSIFSSENVNVRNPMSVLAENFVGDFTLTHSEIFAVTPNYNVCYQSRKSINLLKQVVDFGERESSISEWEGPLILHVAYDLEFLDRHSTKCM